jgi:hypothetical protein
VTNERELILNAVNAGHSSLPQIRTATGLGYDKLYPLLESLTPWEIARRETVDGFDRFYPLGQDPGAEDAREPFCVQCRRRCYWMPPIAINDNAVGKWRCAPCKIVFTGSHTTKKKTSPRGDKPKETNMAHMDVDERAEADRRLTEIRERGKRPAVQLGDEEERAMELMRDENETTDGLCGCGRAAKHVGRCASRRARAAKNGNSVPGHIPASHVPGNNITNNPVLTPPHHSN